MWLRRTSAVLAFGLIALLGVTGLAMSAQMAPDRDRIALEQLERDMGVTVADLCGDTEGPQMRCPLCHGLPDAPECAPSGVTTLLTPHDAWRQSEDLYRAAQRRNLSHAPRAPPVPV